jgi:hypothetical protein
MEHWGFTKVSDRGDSVEKTTEEWNNLASHRCLPTH